MLVQCDIPGAMASVVSSAGPIDCSRFAVAHEAGRFGPARFRRAPGTWKYFLGGIISSVVALFLLVLMTDEAMNGGVLAALLASLGAA